MYLRRLENNAYSHCNCPSLPSCESCAGTLLPSLSSLHTFPAKLFQTFFSTGFVEFNSKTNASGIDGTVTAETDGLLIHTQIWVAVVSIVVLVLGTGSRFWLWDPRKRNIQTSS